MLLRDFPPNGTLIPYTSEQLASLFIMLPALAIAVLVDLIVLIALIWQRDIPIDTQFIISLTFGDFLFSLMEIMIGIGSAVYGGFWIGKTGCLWNEMLIIYTLGASILSIFCMTLHRYLIVVFRINLAQKHVYISLSAIWIGLVGVVGLFVVFEDVDSAVSLQSSLLYCFIAMDYPATSNVLASLFALSFIVGTMVFLCFAYNAIVQKYFQLRANAKQKEMDASGNQPNVKISAQSSKGHQIDLSFGKRHQREKSMGVNELKLVKKSIAIGGSFIGVWLFFVAKIIYELVNQKPVSPVYDVLWGVIATWNPVLNGIILYQYDVKCKQNFNTLLGIDYFRAVSKRVLGKQKRAKTEPPQAAPKGQLNILQMDSRDVKGTIVFSKDTVGPLETVKM